MTIPAEMIILDPEEDGTLQSRIQERVAEAILSGRFRAGERLPSSRALARHLGVSRITVTLAYAELLSDDYIASRGRSGYYVSEDAPRPTEFTLSQSRETVDWSRAIGQRFSGAARLEKPADWRSYRYPFIYGQADETLFDHASWRQSALRALGQRDFDAMTIDYNDADDPRLVEFILRHTLPRRGIAADADEILITLGAQNALWLAAQVLLTSAAHGRIRRPVLPSAARDSDPVPVSSGPGFGRRRRAAARGDSTRLQHRIRHPQPPMPDNSHHADDASASVAQAGRRRGFSDRRG